MNSDAIISTFSPKYQCTFRLYEKVYGKAMRLRQQGESWEKIEKKLHLRGRGVLWCWAHGTLPLVRVRLNEMKAHHLFDLTWKDKKRVTLLFALLGTSYGDMSIDKHTYIGRLTDEGAFGLNNFACDLKGLFDLDVKAAKCKDSRACTLYIPSLITRILVTWGAPVGKKQFVKFKYPPLLKKAPLYARRAFLANLFWCEARIPSRIRNCKGGSTREPRFLIDSSLGMMENHRRFLNAFRKDLLKLGIVTKELLPEKRYTGNYRVGFIANKGMVNTLRVIDQLPTRYAGKSTKIAEGRDGIVRAFDRLAYRQQVYQETKKLHRLGLSNTAIARLLGEPGSPIWRYICLSHAPTYASKLPANWVIQDKRMKERVKAMGQIARQCSKILDVEPIPQRAAGDLIHLGRGYH